SPLAYENDAGTTGEATFGATGGTDRGDGAAPAQDEANGAQAASLTVLGGGGTGRAGAVFTSGRPTACSAAASTFRNSSIARQNHLPGRPGRLGLARQLLSKLSPGPDQRLDPLGRPAEPPDVAPGVLTERVEEPARLVELLLVEVVAGVADPPGGGGHLLRGA